jgi:hypothetical protein
MIEMKIDLELRPQSPRCWDRTLKTCGYEAAYTLGGVAGRKTKPCLAGARRMTEDMYFTKHRVGRYFGIVGCFGSGGKYVIGYTEGVKDYLREALNGKCKDE